MNNNNAFIGRNVEILFKNSISDHPAVLKKIQSYFGICGHYLGAIGMGTHSEKADVKMEFADGRNIDANIKAFSKSGISYNQLTRASVETFCKRFLLENIRLELEGLVIKKAKNTNSKLIPEHLQEKYRRIFEEIAKEMVEWSLSYKKSREIIVIYERDDSIMRIYPMKDVLKNFDYSISFTKNGNIAIGDCIIFQRKGGNGDHSKSIPKDSIKHPGNNVQLKLKMNEFILKMESVLLAEYQI